MEGLSLESYRKFWQDKIKANYTNALNAVEDYDEQTGKWHVRPSVKEYESASYEVHNKKIGGRTPVDNNAKRFHQTAIARDINNVKKRRG